MADLGGVRPREFFRLRLLRARTPEEVQGLIAELDREANDLLDHVVSMLWHMRGGLSWDTAWNLCPKSRTSVVKFIQERLKIVEKTKLPLI